MKKLAALFCAVAILGLSCEDNKDQITANPEDLSYFPLEVGTRWEYEGIGPSSLTSSSTFTIVSIETLGGKEYFGMEMVYRDDERGWSGRDTIFFRMDDRGYVYELASNNQERNRFRLGATDGYRWTMASFDREDFTVSTSVTDVQLGAELLSDCKKFYYDIPGMADEEHYYILAKDLGIVEHGNAWGFNYRLKARIK